MQHAKIFLLCLSLYFLPLTDISEFFNLSGIFIHILGVGAQLAFCVACYMICADRWVCQIIAIEVFFMLFQALLINSWLAGTGDVYFVAYTYIAAPAFAVELAIIFISAQRISMRNDARRVVRRHSRSAKCVFSSMHHSVCISRSSEISN